MDSDRIAEHIRKTADGIKSAGFPDFLSRWLRMTPEEFVAMEARMAQKIGPREQQLRDMRKDGKPRAVSAQPAEVCTYPRCRCIVSTSTSQPEPDCPKGLPKQPPRLDEKPKAQPAPKKESDVSKPKKKATKAKAAKPKKTKVVDRSPLAVGTFIVAAGAQGVTMAALEKKFDMDGHPLRSKIHAAKHTIGFTIEYDAARKVYTGTAPHAEAAE